MINHWVVSLLMKPIDVGKSFNIRVIICELKYSLNYDDVIEYQLL